jgi:hypothetical protein
MKRETLLPFITEHGRLTAYAKGERQVIWGVITDVNGNHITLTNHQNEQQNFEFKDIRGFRREKITLEKTYQKLLCDCGCKAEERFICERCGKTFCGSHHGMQVRNTEGKAQDLCGDCCKEVKGI